MSKKKSLRRSIVASLTAGLLSLTMLVGTTFAWFTDSVTSNNNLITAGNLDVELEYMDENGNWALVEEDTNVFKNDTLWEPGHTEVVYFKLENVGSLAFKYQFGVNIVNETAGVNKDGQSFMLSDYIYFDMLDGVNGEENAYATREDALSAVTEETLIANGYSEAGEMHSGDVKYMAMVVYMPTTVGNEVNHNGENENVPTIELGINVLATQTTYEEDSYDETYDEEAELVNTIVTSEAELVKALADAKNGDVIGIKGNVTWTTGAGIGSTPFVTDATYITLRGIGENPTFTALGSGVGGVGIDNGTVIFKNLKIVDQSVSYAENSWEYGYLEFRGNTVFENCDVVNAIMMEGKTATFVDCSFNSHKDNEYAVWVSDGTATFENCTFKGARGLKVHEAYGSEVVSVSVNNSKFVELSKKPGVALGTLNEDTAISFTNNQFIGTQAGDQGNYKYETDTDLTTIEFVDNNNIVAGVSSIAGLYVDEDGTYYATTTAGLNSAISGAHDGETIVLGSDVTYTGNGYANITKDITLDLNGNNINTTSLGVVAKAGTIKNGTVTNPVGSRAAIRTWSGVSIENVTVVSPKNGGITVASGNTLPSIKNVTIVASTYGIELQNYASVGVIENVTITAGKNGIVAQAATVGEIKNCTINGAECGVWAQLKGTQNLELTFADSTVIGGNYGLYVCDEGTNIVPDGVAKINYDATTTFEGGVKDKEFAFGQANKLYINGGKIAFIISSAEDLFAFAKAVNEEGKNFSGSTVFMNADVDLKNALWTPIGQTGATEFKGTFDGDGHTIKNLNVDSSAQTGKHYSSGLFGWTEANVTIKNVNIDGATVKGNHNVAVIVGYTYSGKVINCHVSNATIVCTHANDDACGDKCGILAGYAGDESRFTNCSATNCTVRAGRDAGQLIGTGYNVSVKDCMATNVTVTATGECTGNNIKTALIGRVMG